MRVLALAAALALAPIGASAVTYDLITSYSYFYYAPDHTVSVQGLGNPDGVAHVGADDGTERPDADFGVYFKGGDRDLGGYTFTYNGMGLEQTDGDLTFWLFPYKDAITGQGSFLSFGDGNGIEAWDIQGGGSYLSAFTIGSTPTQLAFSDADLGNPEAVNGIEIYDWERWVGQGTSRGFHDALYTTRPGRWEFRRDQYCLSPSGEDVSMDNCSPVIAHAPLMGHAPVIAHAPIPASGLLFGSVLLIGGAFLRRAAPAAREAGSPPM